MRLKRKIIIFIAALLALLFFSSDFALIDIEKTAIIVALGIDKKEDGIEITAQIGVPHATEQALDNNDTIISAEGKTVMEAVENLSKYSGWFPKLSFCNIIIFGRKIAEDDISAICDRLLASEQFQNSALLAVSDSTAKKMLTTKTPLDAISSFAIQKVLLENGASSSGVMDTNLKEFSEDTHGRKACGFMPLIKIIEDNAEGQEDSSSAITTSYNFEQKTCDNGTIDQHFDIKPLESGGEDKGDSPTAIFDATQTAVFKDGKIVTVLDKDETIAYNLLHVAADRIILSTKSNDIDCALEIFGSKKKISVDYGNTPMLNIKLKLTVKLADTSLVTDDGKDYSLFRRSAVPKEFCDSLKNDLIGTFENFTARMLNNDIDLFGVRDLIYKYHNKYYEDYKKIPLQLYKVNLDISVVSKDNVG